MARVHPGPDGNGETVAGWPVTDELRIPADAVSGYYVANLVLTSGSYRGEASTVFFVVRPSPGNHSAILVQVPVNTWQAYNEWGGKSLYGFNSTDLAAANRVSFDRPVAPAGQWPIVWEVPLIRFLEREGYDVSYQTDLDTHVSPGSLLDHRLVMISGHDEYWTKEMRDAFEAARDAGTNLAFMGANAGYWQVRYEDGGRTIVGYKSNADPIADPALRTILFRDLGRPECQLEGVMHQGGLPARDAAVALDRWGQSAAAHSAPLAVPDTAPVVRLRTPRPCRRGAREVFVARATDRDGDALTYSWTLDGHVVSGRGANVSARMRRRGLHHVTVAVSDGHGRTTRARALVHAT